MSFDYGRGKADAQANKVVSKQSMRAAEVEAAGSLNLAAGRRTLLFVHEERTPQLTRALQSCLRHDDENSSWVCLKFYQAS